MAFDHVESRLLLASFDCFRGKSSFFARPLSLHLCIDRDRHFCNITDGSDGIDAPENGIMWQYKTTCDDIILPPNRGTYTDRLWNHIPCS